MELESKNDSKILIVDDEKNIVNILKFNLQKEGYQTIEAYDGEEALHKIDNESPDLILLDIMMPILDGFSVCSKVRRNLMTPIIMLTAKSEEIDKVLGLELGADDYMTKPFSVRELLARIKANLRKSTKDLANSIQNDIIKGGSIELNIDNYEVKINGKKVELTLREFELLKFLMYSPNKIFTREELLLKVWRYEYFGDIRTVDVTVRRMREKIEENPSYPIYVSTKRGVGYYFNSAENQNRLRKQYSENSKFIRN